MNLGPVLTGISCVRVCRILNSNSRPIILTVICIKLFCLQKLNRLSSFSFFQCIYEEGRGIWRGDFSIVMSHSTTLLCLRATLRGADDDKHRDQATNGRRAKWRLGGQQVAWYPSWSKNWTHFHPASRGLQRW